MRARASHASFASGPRSRLQGRGPAPLRPRWARDLRVVNGSRLAWSPEDVRFCHRLPTHGGLLTWLVAAESAVSKPRPCSCEQTRPAESVRAPSRPHSASASPSNPTLPTFPGDGGRNVGVEERMAPQDSGCCLPSAVRPWKTFLVWGKKKKKVGMTIPVLPTTLL